MVGKVVRESDKDIFFVTPDGAKVRLPKDSFELLPIGEPMEAKIIVKPKHKVDKIDFGVFKE